MSHDELLTQHLVGLCEEQIELSLDELCRACAVQTQIIIELVDEGVLDLSPSTPPSDWRFDARNMRRARVALRLQRDLGVNLAGAALALQLMEEIDVLRSRLRLLGGD